MKTLGLYVAADADGTWERRQRELATAGHSIVESQLQAIEAQNELESDEFHTARQKAVAIYVSGKRKPKII